MTEIDRNREEEAMHYADQVLSWHGWGSPVGLGLFLVAIATCILLIHQAGLF